jgi:hypothetical protein
MITNKILNDLLEQDKSAKLIKASTTTCSLGSLVLNTVLSGAGGIDTGSIAASTFYYVYTVISNRQVKLVASTSAASPTGFTSYMKVGAFYTNSSSSIFKAYYFGETNRTALSATVNSAGTLTFQSSPNWISSTSISSNVHTINFNSDVFSIVPSVVPSSALSTNTPTSFISAGPTVSSVGIMTRETNTGAAIARTIFVICGKQGIDATQPDWTRM